MAEEAASGECSGEAAESSGEDLEARVESASTEREDSRESAEHHASASYNASEEKRGSSAERAYRASGSESGSKRTIHGAVALITHYDPETGEGKLYLEEKPQDYALPEQRGRLALPGGAIDTTDPDSKSALEREIEEEFMDEEAKEVLIRILRQTNSPYTVLRDDVDGETAFTYVYHIDIPDKEDWAKVEKGELGHDAGPKRVLTFEEARAIPPDRYAFSLGYAIHKYLSEVSAAPKTAALLAYSPKSPAVPSNSFRLAA